MSLPLIIKLSTATISGAFFLVACQHSRRNETLQSQLSEIRNVLRDISPPVPAPVVLVMGFKGHGKSSFINTVCRVLRQEDGPLIFRTETAPVGPTRTTAEPKVVDAAGLVTLVDSPGLPVERLTRAHLEGILGRAIGRGVGPECTLVVFRCTDAAHERPMLMRRLIEIVAAIRDKGLPYVVVLTHKRALKNKEQAEGLRKEVASRARTHCVYFLENYTASSNISYRCPTFIKNNFDTHNLTLTIVRQCLEFALVRRNDSFSILQQREKS